MASTINASTSAGLISTGDTSGVLALQTNSGTTAVTIDTSQAVGINVTPNAWGSGYSPIQGLGYSLYSGNTVQARLSANEYFSNTASTYRVNGLAALYQQSSGIHSWFTAPSGTAGNAITFTESMRIDSSGRLLVGTTSANGNGLLQLTQATTNSDSAVFRNSSASPYGIVVDWTAADPNNANNYVFGGYDSFSATWMYRIYSNGTVAARSDARFKKNVETARNGYADDLSKLRVVKYNWINNADTDPKELGLIAQEVEEVFPSLVQTDVSESGVECKSIKFSVLPIMLLKAIQELKAINDQQAETINALTARVVALESKA